MIPTAVSHFSVHKAYSDAKPSKKYASKTAVEKMESKLLIGKMEIKDLSLLQKMMLTKDN